MHQHHKSKKQLYLVILLKVVTFLVLASSSLTYFRSTNWLVELFANFQLQYTLIFLSLTLFWIWLKKPLWGVMTTFAFIFNFLTLLPFYFQPTVTAALPVNSSEKIRILFANFNYNNENFDQFAGLVQENQPDIVAMVELPDNHFQSLKQLLTPYTQTHHVAARGQLGLALYVKPTLKATFETKRLENLERYPFVVATLEQSSGIKATLFLIHPPPPITAQASETRNQILLSIASLAAETDGPVMVVGDFNSTSWSAIFNQMLETGNLTDSRLNFGLQPSWPQFLPKIFRIPIDHVLVKNINVIDRKIMTEVGSDHLPVLVDFETN